MKNQMTIPDEAVQAAAKKIAPHTKPGEMVYSASIAGEALIAALPFLTGDTSPRAQALEEAAKIAFDVSENGEYHGEASVDSTSSIYQQGAFEVYEAIRALSSQPVADGCKGEWREIEYNHALKGRRVNPAYFPSNGEVCEISGPNCDDDKDYTWGETTVLWQNEMFVLYGKAGYWPVLHKHEHVLFRPLPASPGASE